MSGYQIKLQGGTILLVFVILKFTGVIDWSWLWVLSPIWLPIAAVILILLAGMLIAIGVSLIYWIYLQIRNNF